MSSLSLDIRMPSASSEPSPRVPTVLPRSVSPAPQRRFRVGLFLVALLWSGAGRAGAAGYFDGRHYPIVTDGVFTADEFILEQARFWYAIYVEVDDNEGLIHDPFYPDLVFRKVSAPGQGRASSKLVKVHVQALQEEIRVLVSKDSSLWTPQERQIKAVFPSFWDSTAIRLSTERLRFQRGLKRKYREGLERSYRYLPLIDSVLAEHGVPSRLKFLPHVESSFYPFAYSKVGAAGMWQFMKSSAHRYKMKVGYHVDERRDPHASTLAAARMLAGNFSHLKSWPLAIVAYNHGPSGVARAVKASGSRDLGTIIKSYYSNSFGFASKNFYAEFLAASSIALKADSLYPDLRKLEPLRFHSLILNKPLGTRYLCAITGLSPQELEEYNLGLRPATFRGNGQLPKGFALRLPLSVDLLAVSSKLGGAEIVARASGPGAASLAAGPVASAQAASPASAGAITDSLPDATLPVSAAQDKVESPAGNALAAVKTVRPVPEERSAAARKAREKKVFPETKPSASIAAMTVEGGRGADGEAGSDAPPAPGAKPASVPQSAAVKRMAAAASSADAAHASPAANAASATGFSAGMAGPPAAPGATPPPQDRVVDSTLALQATDMDKLAHPMDRFNPSIYNLDYVYADGNLLILAGPEETLSHYAEWAWVPESTLRRLNRIRNPRDFRLGRKIRIPIAEDKAKEFVKRREENYRAVEEDFYGNYYVSVTEPLRVEKGMNLWTWSQEREIPFWLLQKHNPGKALNEVHPGDTLNLPAIETGNRKWGFTRYGNSAEYLSGISRFLASGKPEAY